jgi:predicted dehydrogenase
MIHAGLIGCGNIAKKYATIINEVNGIKITKIYDLDQKKCEEIQKMIPNVKIAKNESDLLDNIDALIIATPPKNHFQIAKKATSKKIDLFIEKPITLDYSETKKLVELCKKNSLVLNVNFQYRFSNIFYELQKAIKKNIFGEIIFVNFKINWLRDNNYYSGWRGNKQISGGGVIINQAIHFIDFAIAQFGLPQSIYCIEKNINKRINVEDVAFITLNYKKGPIIYFRASTCTFPDMHDEIDISGTKGDLRLSQINVGGIINRKTFKKDNNLFKFSPDSTSLVNNKKALQNFVKTVKLRQNNFDEILKTMLVIDKIYLSSKKQQKVLLK